MSRSNDHEQTPLLGSDTAAATTSNDDVSKALRSSILIGIKFAIFSLLLEVSMLGSVAKKQIFEGIICRDIYSEKGPAIDCGADEEVQGQLALLLAWRGTVSLIPGLIMAIPYGIIADRYGHKPVIMLAVLGQILAESWTMLVCWYPDIFPIYWALASSLWTFLGGGGAVIGPMILANLSDLTSETYRASVFSYLSIILLSARFGGVLLEAHLIQQNVWLPLWLALGGIISALLFSTILPTSSGSSKSMPVVNTEANESNEQVHNKRISRYIRNAISSIKTNISFLQQQPDYYMMKLMAALVASTLAWQSIQILGQLVRARLNWPWSQIGYLYAFETAISVAILLLFLPSASYVLAGPFGMSANARDLVLAQISCICLVIGAIIIGVSENTTMIITGIVVFYLGTIYNMVLKSLLASSVDSNSATLFNCVGMLETIGSLVSGPLMASLFNLGLSLHGVWLGLPLFVGAVFAIVAIVILSGASKTI